MPRPTTLPASATAPTVPLRDATDAYLSWFIVAAHRQATGPAGADLLAGAIEHVVAAHRGQTRTDENGDPTPYVLHPLRNTARLLNVGVTDLDTLIAELFHDTVEDVPDQLVKALTGDSVSEPLPALRAAYGHDVARIVEAVTNPGEHSALPRTERNIAYVAHVTAEVRNDVRVALVKASDVLDNAGGLTALAGRNPAMAKRLARKYSPLIPVLIDALDINEVEAFTGDVDLLCAELEAVGLELDHLVNA